MFYCWFESPIGPLLLAGSEDGLRMVGFSTGRRAVTPLPGWKPREAPFREAKRQLTQYFDGRRRAFDLPLAPRGTAFQRRVWNALSAIPYGETRSYKQIAIVTGNPRAALAVGGANGSNPLPIVVPCHRVIGSDGNLTGYAGGLEAKRYLLDLERANVA